MEYELGKRLDAIIEQNADAQVERTLILKVLQKEFSESYKLAVEELKKEAK
jgi:hypothetical protein